MSIICKYFVALFIILVMSRAHLRAFTAQTTLKLRNVKHSAFLHYLLDEPVGAMFNDPDLVHDVMGSIIARAKRQVMKSACFLLISAKPFSINEALAAESKSKGAHTTALPHSAESTNRFSLNREFTSEPVHKLRKFKSSKHLSSPFKFGNLPSLRTKRLSEITSHLKSRSLSDLLHPLRKHKRKSKKREVFKNGKFDDKYFPLFKNLGLLFDNLLNESSEAYETTKKKYKRRKDNSDERRGVVCSCAVKSDSEPGETKSYKKTALSAKTVTTEPPSLIETSTAAPATTYSSLGYFGRLGQHTDVPLLFSRDSPSSRGDDNGHGKRSRPTFYRSVERDITRNTRNRKHHTRDREQELSTEYDEEDTDGPARNDTSDEPRRRGGRGDPNISNDRNTADEEEISPKKAKKTDDVFRGHVIKFPRKTKFQARRNETKSKEFVRKHVRRIRGPISDDKVNDITESVQSEEDYEESLNSITLADTNDKRLPDASSASTGKNQEIRSRNETVNSFNDITSLNLAFQKSPDPKTPTISFVDGYSVVRDYNGQNKLNEQSIHIHV